MHLLHLSRHSIRCLADVPQIGVGKRATESTRFDGRAEEAGAIDPTTKIHLAWLDLRRMRVSGTAVSSAPRCLVCCCAKIHGSQDELHLDVRPASDFINLGMHASDEIHHH